MNSSPHTSLIDLLYTGLPHLWGFQKASVGPIEQAVSFYILNPSVP